MGHHPSSYYLLSIRMEKSAHRRPFFFDYFPQRTRNFLSEFIVDLRVQFDNEVDIETDGIWWFD